MSIGRSYDFVTLYVKTFWPNLKLIVPLFAALSPNRALLCTISSSLLFTQTAIYSLPKRILEPDVPSSCKGPFLILGTDWQTSDHTSVSLCKAILGRTSTADLMHLICSSNVSQTDLVEALYQALELLEKYKSGSVSSWDIMGLAIEAYRHVIHTSLSCCVNIINPQKNRCWFKSWKWGRASPNKMADGTWFVFSSCL